MNDRDVLEAHVAAMRLMGFHGGSFNHTCSADTCTRPAHWRYYPEANPQLARIAIPGGAYEVYEEADDDGNAAGTGYVVLRRQGAWYTVAAMFSGYVDAMKCAYEAGIEENT